MTPDPVETTVHEPHSILGEKYRERLQGWDEVFSEDGEIRPGWEKMVSAINTLGVDELEKRQGDARRLLRENGVTYTVYDDPHGRNRVWELDPIPFVIDAEDWSIIEGGLKQRAELLNLILTDIYGQRRLIKQNIIPPDIIFGHSGFLRACDGVKISGSQQLLVYGADLARGQDGKMWLYTDRTQVPTGAGYALENRVVMSRVMPQELRDNQVQRLSGFFRQFAQNLQKFSQHRREDPYIVVLTPGPGNETYFEHAYFATYMGYPLVQGGDLLVRDNRVWLKSIDGIKQVDVILRRVDDAYCDPLELREDSMLGVPGLLNVARAGNVVLANPLGSGVLESRGLIPFLDACSRYFLNEDLQISSVATWWCGQSKEREYVLANLEKLVIKNVGNGGTSWLGPMMSKEQISELRARIKAYPGRYVGQEWAEFSTTPAWAGQSGVEPRHMMFRGFLVADGKGYRVMPGGLTRVARDANGQFISNQAGGVSKDTWVLTHDTARQSRPGAFIEVQAISQHEGKLPSRAAENLFWVGRYAERAEGVARLMCTVMDKLADCEDYGDEADLGVLHRLLESLTIITASFPGFVGEGAARQLNMPHEELIALASDRERRGSLAETMSFLLNAAYGVRDLWFGDTWRTVNAIQDAADRLQATAPRLFDVSAQLYRVLHTLTAFAGITAESMRHDHAWILLDLGRRVERASQQALLLDHMLVKPLPDTCEPLLIEALLASSESLMAQRRRFRFSSPLHSALDLLVLDHRHPRSLAYQFERLNTRVGMLPHPNGQRTDLLVERYSTAEKLVIEISTALKLANVNGLTQCNKRGDRDELRLLLTRLRNNLWQLTAEITDTYFSHAPGVRQLAPVMKLPNA